MVLGVLQSLGRARAAVQSSSLARRRPAPQKSRSRACQAGRPPNAGGAALMAYQLLTLCPPPRQPLP